MTSTDSPQGHPRRNHVIDLARAASVAVVVFFHGLAWQVRLDDGVPAVTPWAAPPILYPLTWVLMVMPLFFVAGGFSHALVVDRMHRESTGYGRYLAMRGRRLVGPLIPFVTLGALAATAGALLGWPDAAADLSRQLMQLLWFITVYLVIVAAAPALVAAHDRFGGWGMLVLLALAAAVDAWSFAVDDHEVRNLNMLLVWPLVHQFGVAYQRGWFRSGPLRNPVAAIVAGAAGVLALVFGAGYPPTSVGFADLTIANVQPPTVAMVALALAQTGALGLLERSGVLAHPARPVVRALGVANALAVTTYLWHIPVIFLVVGALLGISLAMPAVAGVALAQLTVATAALLGVAALVPLIALLDQRAIPPLGGHQDGRLAVAAFGCLFVGTGLVWLNGTVLLPGHPWSSAGVLAIWLGSWLMVRAADSPAAMHEPQSAST